jgi:hypothetical protein
VFIIRENEVTLCSLVKLDTALLSWSSGRNGAQEGTVLLSWSFKYQYFDINGISVTLRAT